MKKIIVTILIHCLCITLTFAQLTFSKIFQNESPASVISSIYVTDSCIYAMGIFGDSIDPSSIGNGFIKYDFEGNILSNKKLSSPVKSYEIWRGVLQPTSDGNIAAAGYSIDSIGMKCILIKYNQMGDTIFTSEFLSPTLDQNFFYLFKDMIINENDDFVLINRTVDSTLASNPELLILDKYGNKKLSKVYLNNLREVPESLIKDGDGFIIGTWNSNLHTTTYDFTSLTHIFKVDTLGNIIWEYQSPANMQQQGARAMVKTSDNGLVVASGIGQEHYVNPSTNYLYFDLYLFKLDENQNVEWEVDYSSLDTGILDRTRFFQILDVGDGYVASGINVDSEWPAVEDGYLVKVSPDGERLWERKFHIVENVIGTHELYDLRQTPDGGFIMSGQINDFGQLSIGQSGWLVKVDEHGCLVPDCHLPDATLNILVDQPFIKTYPNPTSDMLNIYFKNTNQSKDGVFRLIDLQGRVVQEFDADKNDITFLVSLEKYASGIYFLQYFQRGILIKSEKVIIQK